MMEMIGDFAEVAIDQFYNLSKNALTNKYNDPWLEYFHEDQIGPIRPNKNLPPIADKDETLVNYFFNGGNPKTI